MEWIIIILLIANIVINITLFNARRIDDKVTINYIKEVIKTLNNSQ